MSDYDIVAAHVTKTLPDSITERKVVLESLSRLMPLRAKCRPNLLAMLQHLNNHLIEQREFPFTDAIETKGKQ